MNLLREKDNPEYKVKACPLCTIKQLKIWSYLVIFHIAKNFVQTFQSTIAIMGYGPEDKNAVLELTYNYGVTEYDKGNGYAQVKTSLVFLHMF